jgi:hypothetical protein
LVKIISYNLCLKEFFFHSINVKIIKLCVGFWFNFEPKFRTMPKIPITNDTLIF